jgi:hypothetical protein
LRLFWILGLGGAASEGKPERSWFMEEFRVVRDIVGVRSWEDAKPIVVGVLWHPELDGIGKRFWDEVNSRPPSAIGTWNI